MFLRILEGGCFCLGGLGRGLGDKVTNLVKVDNGNGDE